MSLAQGYFHIPSGIGQDTQKFFVPKGAEIISYRNDLVGEERIAIVEDGQLVHPDPETSIIYQDMYDLLLSNGIDPLSPYGDGTSSRPVFGGVMIATDIHPPMRDIHRLARYIYKQVNDGFHAPDIESEEENAKESQRDYIHVPSYEGGDTKSFVLPEYTVLKIGHYSSETKSYALVRRGKIFESSRNRTFTNLNDFFKANNVKLSLVYSGNTSVEAGERELKTIIDEQNKLPHSQKVNMQQQLMWDEIDRHMYDDMNPDQKKKPIDNRSTGWGDFSPEEQDAMRAVEDRVEAYEQKQAEKPHNEPISKGYVHKPTRLNGDYRPFTLPDGAILRPQDGWNNAIVKNDGIYSYPGGNRYKEIADYFKIVTYNNSASAFQGDAVIGVDLPGGRTTTLLNLIQEEAANRRCLLESMRFALRFSFSAPVVEQIINTGINKDAVWDISKNGEVLATSLVTRTDTDDKIVTIKGFGKAAGYHTGHDRIPARIRVAMQDGKIIWAGYDATPRANGAQALADNLRYGPAG